MKIRHRSIMASTDKDYASLRGVDFRKARDILTKDGFHEHEYGDKDNNNGYAVYRKGDKEVELTYEWVEGKRKGEAHAGKVVNIYVDDDINAACGKKSVKSAKNIKRKPRNVQVYFWHNNAYNAVVMTDGEYWITFDESFDGIDLYDEDVIDELKSYVKTADFNSFDDMYNQFANDENGNSPVVGDNFGGEFDSSELTKVGTIYEGKTNSACDKKSVKSNKINKRRAITAAEGLNDMKIIVKSEAFVDITVDDYEQGALNMVNSWDFDVRGEYDTLQELIDRIADESYVFSNNIADYYYMDGRIGTSATVDADNSVPTDDQYEAWKRGEETLYIADLYLPLEVGGGSHEMTEEEAEAFGLALY